MEKDERQLPVSLAERYFDRSFFELVTFEDLEQEKRYWFSFIDMLSMEALWMKENCPSLYRRRVGGMLSDVELMRALEPEEVSDEEEQAFIRMRADNRRVFVLLAQCASASITPLSSLLTEGRLEPVEIMAFIMAVAVDLNRKYERIFGILSEETVSVAKPTVGLVSDYCSLFMNEDEKDITALFDSDSFLYRFILEPMHENKGMSRLSRPLSLERRVLSMLLGNRLELGALNLCCEMFPCKEEPGPLIAHSAESARLGDAFTGALALDVRTLFVLKGRKGVGRRFLVKTLAHDVNMDVCFVNVPILMELSPEKVGDLVREMALLSVVGRKLIYLDGLTFEGEAAGFTLQLISQLEEYVSIIFASTEEEIPDKTAISGNIFTIEVEAPGSRLQLDFWRYMSASKGIYLEEDIKLKQLVSKYDLTPGKIESVLESAGMAADTCESGLYVDRELLEEQIRAKCSVGFGAYARRLSCPFTVKDLELEEMSLKLVEEACNRVRYRSTVNDDYGFARKVPYGNGISIVLYGPPGTGKTMTAQVMAKELGLDIYRIDLSQIGSKYIGETEKNLKSVFEAARYSNAILFFDEADSLFAKRTDVSNSNDKHANAETGFLLQKIEEHPGISILATNVMQNFDSAFKRRMTYMIPISQPDAATRLKLWQKIYPADTPLESGLRFDVFAEAAELTGSSIKSVALLTAYRAAASGKPISNDDIIAAIDDEYRKTGRLPIEDKMRAAMRQ